VAVSEVDLITKDAEGNRLVRHTETNLGSLCADAFRSVTNADIGYINGGNLRSDILAGDITFNDLLNVLPFNNTVVLAEISGQTLRDMMEMAMKIWPEENGAFPHTSGIMFSVNTAIPSSVELNEQEEFIGVSGQYRVYDMKVFNRETGKYEPVDLTKTYTIAATNYYLLEYGSGMKMLENSVIVQNDGLLDVEVLERYIMEELGGAVGQKYAEAIKNITYTEGEIHTPEDETDAAESTPGTTDEGSAETDTTETTPGTTDDGSVETDAPDRTVLIVCITLGAVIILAAIFFAVRRIGSGKRKA
jgi:2',3'-cyclic-nucleotide 2'-phosphodiesterase (5'-nucleotidase family)